MSVTPTNIFGYFKNNSVSAYSSTVTIDALDEEGNEMRINGVKEPIEIEIPRTGMPATVPTVEYSKMSEKDDDASLFYYKFNVSAKGASLHVRIIPERTGVQFLVFARHNSFPKLNGTKRGWDFMQNLPESMENISELSSILVNVVLSVDFLVLWRLY